MPATKPIPGFQSWRSNLNPGFFAGTEAMCVSTGHLFPSKNHFPLTTDCPCHSTDGPCRSTDGPCRSTDGPCHSTDGLCPSTDGPCPSTDEKYLSTGGTCTGTPHYSSTTGGLGDTPIPGGKVSFQFKSFLYTTNNNTLWLIM